jgi:hypothetical protein
MNATIATLALSLCSSLTALAGDLHHQDPEQISCTPKLLRPGGTLTIRLGPNHGREMSIGRRSDQTVFMVVVGSPPANAMQLMTTDELAKSKEVRLPYDIEGTTWDAAARKERIFRRPGEYEVWVSENLETETNAYYCKFKVAGAR